MKVLVVINGHLYKNSDGKYYSPSIYNYSFFERYLKVFDEVRVLSKVKEVSDLDIKHYLLVSGDGLEIFNLPWYQGMKEMLKKIFSVVKTYKKVCEDCSCYIFRVAQVESFMAYLIGRKKNIPYVVEIVNDPETFVDLPYWMRWISIYLLKKMTINAQGASYVTEFYLQNKYPNYHFKEFYSSIELKESDISQSIITFNSDTKFRIIHVANAINNELKGHSVLIKSIKLVKDKGYDIEAYCVGQGNKVSEFEQLAQDLGISDNVRFIGRIHDKSELLDIMASCNLLVLPTKMEGLPRTIIEAMAVGLPCISTPIAGIPELLRGRYLFHPDNVKGFADEIIRLINCPEELREMSRENIEKAKQYTKEQLEPKRISFYKKLKALAGKE